MVGVGAAKNMGTTLLFKTGLAFCWSCGPKFKVFGLRSRGLGLVGEGACRGLENIPCDL